MTIPSNSRKDPNNDDKQSAKMLCHSQRQCSFIPFASHETDAAVRSRWW